MEYTINKLAQMSGVSTRTLRYYDEIGLLKPKRVNSNGYHIYGKDEVDKLQQILLYRELGVELNEIRKLLTQPDFDAEIALRQHLTALLKKKEQIQILIENVSKTIDSLRGEVVMSDKEKFEGFKQKLIEENQRKYGKEIREKYGDDAINASNAKIKGMTTEEYKRAESLRLEIDETLKAAMEIGDPAGDLAQRVCELHNEWLIIYYPGYSKEYHKGLGEMYVADERFRAYYDRIGEGAAEFLRDAINVYSG